MENLERALERVLESRIRSSLASGLLLVFAAVLNCGAVTTIDFNSLPDSGDGWTLSNNKVILNGAGPYVLTGDARAKMTAVLVSADATVTISNLYLKVKETTMKVDDGKNLQLFLAGVNSLESSGGTSAAIEVEGSASIAITNAPYDVNGQLTAIGGDYSACIGCSYFGESDGGTVTILGGTIFARSEYAKGSGIGGGGLTGKVYIRGGNITSGCIGPGYNVKGGHVEIYGGQIDANACWGASGIGGTDTEIFICGGRINATGGSMGGIGGGYLGPASSVVIRGGTIVSGGDKNALYANKITIAGGSVNASSFNVSPSNDVGDVLVQYQLIGGEANRRVWLEKGSAPAYYGQNDLYTDEQANLYLWLPAGYSPTISLDDPEAGHVIDPADLTTYVFEDFESFAIDTTAATIAEATGSHFIPSTGEDQSITVASPSARISPCGFPGGASSFGKVSFQIKNSPLDDGSKLTILSVAEGGATSGVVQPVGTSVHFDAMVKPTLLDELPETIPADRESKSNLLKANYIVIARRGLVFAVDNDIAVFPVELEEPSIVSNWCVSAGWKEEGSVVFRNSFLHAADGGVFPDPTEDWHRITLTRKVVELDGAVTVVFEVRIDGVLAAAEDGTTEFLALASSPTDETRYLRMVGRGEIDNLEISTTPRDFSPSSVYLPSDGMLDTNRDGVPDAYVDKYRLSDNYNENVREYNDDDDFLPPDPGASSPYSSLIPGLIQPPRPQPFTAVLEIRGYGEGLNDAPFQLGIGESATRIYTDPDIDANSTLTKLEYLAWTDFTNSNPTAEVSDWTAERPTDPTKADTDDDGIEDGVEYDWWYRAIVGYINQEGAHVYATGRRLADSPTIGEAVITRDLIAIAMDPQSECKEGADSDGDGLSNVLEIELGTNPFDYDTDGDGVTDAIEIFVTNTDPLRVQTVIGVPDKDVINVHDTYCDYDGENHSLEYEWPETLPAGVTLTTWYTERPGGKFATYMPRFTEPGVYTCLCYAVCQTANGAFRTPVKQAVLTIRDPEILPDGYYERTVSGHTWRFYIQDGEATVCGCEFFEGHVLDVPNSLGGCPVVAIASSAFSSQGMRAVLLPAGIRSIGWFAFAQCNNLMEISIPEGLKTIEGQAFWECVSLASLHLPASLTYFGIEEGALVGCTSLFEITVDVRNQNYEAHDGILYSKDGRGLLFATKNHSSVTIPSRVVYIGGSAFERCDYLTSIVIPSNVEWINMNAFANCANLSSVAFSGSNTSFDPDQAFYGTPYLASLQEGFILSSKGYAIAYYGTMPGNVELPEGCVGFSPGLFCCKANVYRVNLPSTVRSIPDRAFESCVNLESVSINEGCEEIGFAAFANCPHLSSLSLPQTITTIGGSAFNGCSNLVSLDLPSTITDIGPCAFSECTSLTALVLPEGVSRIEYGTFRGCSSLQALNIPASVTYIDTWSGTFERCDQLSGLVVDSGNPQYSSQAGILYNKGRTFVYFVPKTVKSVVVPPTVTAIEAQAFMGCSLLREIALPDSLTYIGWEAFRDCSSLETVQMPSGVQCDYASAFAGTPYWENREDGVVINDGVVIGWKGECDDNLVIPEGVTEIADYALNYAPMTTIALPSTLVRIGYYAFQYCPNLNSVDLPDSLVDFGWSPFYGCDNLKTISIPNGVDFVGIGLLEGCQGLEEVHLADDNPDYQADGPYVFDKSRETILYALPGISVADIPEGVVKIGSNAFAGCQSLTSVSFPDTLVEIADWAFGSCPSLFDFTIPETVKIIGASVFDGTGWWESQDEGLVIKDGCLLGYKGYGAMSIAVPSGVRLIATSSLWSCQQTLQVLSIPGTVRTVPPDAFSSYSALEAVYFGEGVEEICDYAFAWCRNLTTVYLPKSITQISRYSFWSCDKLDDFIVPEGGETVVEYGGFIYNKNTMDILSVDKSRESLALPEGVVSLWDGNLLEGCDRLTTLTLPSTMQSVSRYVLDPCGNLSSILVSAANRYLKSSNGVIYTKDGYRLVAVAPAVTDVVIQEGVQSIDYGAFRDNQRITSVSFPASLKRIESEAFLRCANLTDFTLTDSLESIGGRAFDECGWWNAQPDGLVVKDGWVLGAKGAVSSVVIDDSCSLFADGCFGYDSSVQSVAFDSPRTALPASIFNGCTSLISVTLPETLTAIPDNSFSGCSALTTLRIPSSVERIGDAAFSGCTSLSTISLPSGTKAIGLYAFASCTGLKALALPTALESVGYQSFVGCQSLKKFMLSSGNPNFTVIDGVLYDKDVTRLVAVPGAIESLVLPESVRLIEFGAFQECQKLKSVVIPEGVEEIPSYTFVACESLASVSLPSTIRWIGESAFAQCVSLEELEIPDNIEFIGRDAFIETPFMENQGEGLFVVGGIVVCLNGVENPHIVIPEGVHTVLPFAFAEHTEIATVSIPDTVMTIGDNAFAGCTSLDGVNLPQGLTSLGSGVFADCHSLTAIEVPNGVPYLNSNLFTGCASLKRVTLHKGLQGIGYWAFGMCRALTEVNLPEGLTIIDACAFDSCLSLERINLPDSLIELGPEAFVGCEKLIDSTTVPGLYFVDGWLVGYDLEEPPEFLEIPEWCIGLAREIFCDCDTLLDVYIPGSVRRVPDYEFANCDNLLFAELGEGVESIGQCAFASCPWLSIFNIPESVSSIGQGLLSDTAIYEDATEGLFVLDDCVLGFKGNCPETVDLATGFRVVADGIFAGSETLREIRLPEYVSFLDQFSFQYCPNLETVSVACTNIEIFSLAFYGCPKLSNVTNVGSVAGCVFKGWRSPEGKTTFVTDSSGYLTMDMYYILKPVWEKEGALPSEDVAPTLGDLAEVFGEDSDVAKNITDDTELAAFNGFLKDCSISSASDLTPPQKQYAYQSFKLSEVTTAPLLFEEEPVLKIDDIELTGGNLSLTISLTAGAEAIQLAKDKLAEKIRVGSTIGDITGKPTIVASPAADGTSLTFTITPPVGNQGFIRVVLE